MDPEPMDPEPHQHPNIVDAARNEDIQILRDDGTETKERAYLMWNSPDVKCAYQRWPGRPSQELSRGRGFIVLANVLLRDN